jgi:predicted TIM-barrel fold metal-dependent hydrolase
MANAVQDERTPIVDVDVHPMYKQFRDLEPYLSSRWRQRFETRGIRTYARARDRYNHPEYTQRRDATPPDGGHAGSDRVFTIENHLEPNGIDGALLLPQQPYGAAVWGDAQAANAYVAATNDFFLEQWCGYDDRYCLAVTVTPHDPSLAAEEIRRHAGKPGVVGVQLMLLDRMMGDRAFDPIYEAACEAGLPVVVHQTGSEGCYPFSPTPAGGAPRSYGERHVVLTQIGAANVCDLVVGGAFERFPSLKIAFVEWGFSWIAPLVARLDHLWERDPDAAPEVRRPPGEYVREHMTFATQPLDEPGSRLEWDALFGMQGLDRMLLFASDYPHYDADDATFILRGRVPKDLRAPIAYRNAVSLFGDEVLRSLRTPKQPVTA